MPRIFAMAKDTLDSFPVNSQTSLSHITKIHVVEKAKFLRYKFFDLSVVETSQQQSKRCKFPKIIIGCSIYVSKGLYSELLPDKNYLHDSRKLDLLKFLIVNKIGFLYQPRVLVSCNGAHFLPHFNCLISSDFSREIFL